MSHSLANSTTVERDPFGKARNTIAGWRTKLLDLSPANRLLRFRVTRLSCVPVVAPDLPVLFRKLVLNDKPLSMVSGRQAEIPAQGSMDLVDDAYEESNDQTLASGRRYGTETKSLASSYEPDHLASALYNLQLKSRASIEERGVNVLYLALGFLTWDDAQEREVRWRAPLILAPVAIERGRANSYTVAALDEDVVLNPTLAYKLDHDFGLPLPELPDDLEGFDLDTYLSSIEGATESLTNRAVERAAYLGLFSFLKMPMYQDLTQHADDLLQHRLIARLAGMPAAEREVSVFPSFGAKLDQHLDPHQIHQVLDADSSQQETLLVARAGAHLLIEGPPGTGKSQTIANLIAEGLADGKRVLFVSEKAAALEVVKKRLDACSIGEACLDLHSHKVDKKRILADLERTLYQARTEVPGHAGATLESVAQVRDALNDYVSALHAPRFAAQTSAYRIYGLLAQLQSAPTVHCRISDAAMLSSAEMHTRRELLEVLVTHSHVLERLNLHPWRGLKPRPPSFAYTGELREHLDSLATHARNLAGELEAARVATGWSWPAGIEELSVVAGALRDYRAEALALPLEAWCLRFAKSYASWTHVLNPRYWLDIKELRKLRRAGFSLDSQQIVADLERLKLAAGLLGTTPGLTVDDAVAPQAETVGKTLAALKAELDYFGGQFEADAWRSFGVEQGPTAIIEWCEARSSNLGEVGDYLAYANVRASADAANLRGFLDAAGTQGIPIAALPIAYLRSLYEAWLDEAARDAPILAYFTRPEHEKRIERFRLLDTEQLKLAHLTVAARLAAARPMVGGLAQHAPSAEINVLTREFRKQRRIKPLRKLFREAPQVIQSLKPCFMMSPLTVSQLLAPEHFHFDLAIFDEASQVKVEDSIGCLFRANQIVVAGDSQQLPPTRFFDVMTSDEDWDEEHEDDSAAYESILDALAALPSEVARRMLLWHYRSRHEALIAFSNKNFYGGKLYTFPDPAQAAAASIGAGNDGQGEASPVQFEYVENGIYERGTSRKNPVEAARVVDLIIAHAVRHPEWSLAVVTFSEAQRDAIQRLLDKELEMRPDVRSFFDDAGSEPFRIKNLELIQGDERDALIFSVGYGRDGQGRAPSLNFGPLNKAGGRRRLNVAVTRARRQVTVVSSIQPEELLRSENEGVRLLREYMLLARDGLAALQEETKTGEPGEVESPLEAAIYAALTAAGLKVHPQIGCSGYRIDLAVVDPKNPSRYCLGIECDGATYHSARTARDRDRLRQQVLESLHWRIHRIWSRDWTANPAREVKLVVELVEKYAGTEPSDIKQPTNAKASEAPSDGQGAPGAQPASDEQVMESPELVTHPPNVLPDGVVYYEPFKPTKTRQEQPPYGAGPHIAQIVETQGPTHVDAIIRSLAAMRGIHRLGSQMVASLKMEIRLAVAQERVRLSQDGEFVWPARECALLVRVPRMGDEPRTVAEICPEELREAIKLCLRDAGGGATAEDITRMAVRLYGHQRAMGKVARPVDTVIQQMLREGELAEVGGILRLAEKRNGA